MLKITAIMLAQAKQDFNPAACRRFDESVL